MSIKKLKVDTRPELYQLTDIDFITVSKFSGYKLSI